MEDFIKRYNYVLENRARRFDQIASHDNFVRDHASFNEIFATIIDTELKWLIL